MAPITYKVLACRSRHYRSRSPADIAAHFEERGVPAQEYSTIDDAIRAAIEQTEPGDLILGMGSIFAVAEIRESVLGIPVELYTQLEPAR
jgi:folylpolyglutamate synthase/dihydropteroate synthase